MSEAPSPSARPATRWALNALRVALLPLALLWLSRSISWREAFDHLKAVPLWKLLVPQAALLISTAVAGVRWQLLLSGGWVSVQRWWFLSRLVWMSAFFNALPGGVAGDAMRGLRTQQETQGVLASFSIILIERLLGLLALVTFGLSALALPLPTEARGVIAATSAVAAVFAGGLLVAVLFGGRLTRWLAARVQPATRGQRALQWLGERLTIRVPLARLGVAFMLSLLTNAAALAAIVACISMVAPQAPVSELVATAPALLLLTFIPITPGALGQRELVYAQVLGTLHLAREVGVAASLLMFVSTLAFATAGGVLWLVEGRREP